MTATDTTTLTAWLLDRIAEDEAVARAAQASAPYDEWDAVGLPADEEVQPGALAKAQGSGSIVGINLHVVGKHALSTVTHIARHDPARVLAECAAKRAIVEMFNAEFDEQGLPWGAGGYGEAYCDALRHLAAVYADQPGYRDEWAVQ